MFPFRIFFSPSTMLFIHMYINRSLPFFNLYFNFLCSPGWPQTREPLPQPIRCWDFIDVCHHSWPIFNFKLWLCSLAVSSWTVDLRDYWNYLWLFICVNTIFLFFFSTKNLLQVLVDISREMPNVKLWPWLC